MTSPAQSAHLPPGVEAPRYARSDLTVGIVHIGVGGFHRSHQAMYLDRLMNQGLARDWAICGVGLLPGDARMRDVLRAQDHRYTLVLRHPDGHEEVRVVGSLADRARPLTAFGLVVEALRVRRERGIPPFAVLSCDNISSNGDVARRAFSAYAALRDQELGRFVREEVAFPNSMVDRITPQTTDADRASLRERYGIDDGWPVIAEPFAQWVVEDRFPLGRPRDPELFGDLADQGRFVDPYLRALTLLREQGVRVALEALVG